MKRLVIVCIAMLISGHGKAAPEAVLPSQQVKYEVVDGDTFRILNRKTGNRTGWPDIRIYGIDTPEIRTRCASEKILGLRAKARLQSLLATGPVKLERVARRYDARGRRLLRVYVGGKDVVGVLVGEGLGRVYTGGLRASWCEPGFKLPAAY